MGLDREMSILKTGLTSAENGSSDIKNTYGQIRGELAKLNEELAKKDQELVHKDEQREALAIELARLRTFEAEVELKTMALEAKDREIARLSGELERGGESGRELLLAKVALNASMLQVQGYKKKFDQMSEEIVSLRALCGQQPGEPAKNDALPQPAPGDGSGKGQKHQDIA